MSGTRSLPVKSIRTPASMSIMEGAYRRRRLLLGRKNIVAAWVESPDKPDGLALYDRHYREALETEA